MAKLSRRWLAEGSHVDMARIEGSNNSLNSTALARGIPPFHKHQDAWAELVGLEETTGEEAQVEEVTLRSEDLALGLFFRKGGGEINILKTFGHFSIQPHRRAEGADPLRRRTGAHGGNPGQLTQAGAESLPARKA